MISIQIWHRYFDLEVKYDCYEGEEILPIQKEAVANFSNNIEEIEASLEKVEEYCLENNREDIKEKSITNIFKYVMPEAIFVKRNGTVSIMCRYRFDLEHGLAVVFDKNKFSEVGPQDIIL